MRVLARFFSEVFSQNRVQSLPDTGSNPRSKIVINRLPWWKMLGEVTPLATGSEHVKDGVEDGSPTPLGSGGLDSGWKDWSEEVPLALGKMVWVGSHGNLSLPTGPQNLVQDEFRRLLHTRYKARFKSVSERFPTASKIRS